MKERTEIYVQNIQMIIQARMEEIIDLVSEHLSKSGYGNQLICGIVVTGGGSLLNKVANLFEYRTGHKTRIGKPVENLAQGSLEFYHSPVYSTAIGLLLQEDTTTNQPFQDPIKTNTGNSTISPTSIILDSDKKDENY